MADGLSQEKTQQESEEPAFQVSIFLFLDLDAQVHSLLRG